MPKHTSHTILSGRLARAIAGAVTAVLVCTGVAATAAPASATLRLTQAQRDNMFRAAWGRANMTPMSYTGIVDAGADWCTDRTRFGAAAASRFLVSRVGIAKSNAIQFGADRWFC